MIATLAIYFLILLYISQRSLRKGGRGNNAFSAPVDNRLGGW